MSNSQTIINSLNSLSKWINTEGSYGWDPYDALNSRWNEKLNNAYMKFLLIQINKYSPLNLRPYLGIKKGIDLKGTALLIQAYAKMFRLTQDEMYLDKMLLGLEFVANNSLRDDYGYDCWASHYYPYITIDKNQLGHYFPDIIGTSQSIIALLEGYKLLRDNRYLDLATSASSLLTEELFQDKYPFPYFKYTISEVTKEIVPNASAHALEALTSLIRIKDNNLIREICEKTIDALFRIQSKNGSWTYSLYPDGRIKRKQLDFHQGYIIDGLLSFLPFSEDKDVLTSCIDKGASFYKNILFRRDGSSLYRHPLPYPIDIHNQAQGIITFTKLRDLDKKYSESAKAITTWTVTNMQDMSGYFYYQKWPFFINKTPHMRWGQAWMMLALATFLEKVNSATKSVNGEY